MEEKRQLLIEKMSAEHLEFRESLLEMSKEEILQNAEKYCIQQVILMKLPEINIQDADYDALLQKDHPLTEATNYISDFDYDCAKTISEILIEIVGGDTSNYDL